LDDIEPPSAEPDIAVDLALRGASKGGKASAESDSYLRKQERLLDLQLEHFARDKRLQYADQGLRVLPWPSSAWSWPSPSRWPCGTRPTPAR
jgi:hypothetical protein